MNDFSRCVFQDFHTRGRGALTTMAFVNNVVEDILDVSERVTLERQLDITRDAKRICLSENHSSTDFSNVRDANVFHRHEAAFGRVDSDESILRRNADDNMALQLDQRLYDDCNDIHVVDVYHWERMSRIANDRGEDWSQVLVEVRVKRLLLMLWDFVVLDDLNSVRLERRQNIAMQAGVYPIDDSVKSDVDALLVLILRAQIWQNLVREQCQVLGVKGDAAAELLAEMLVEVLRRDAEKLKALQHRHGRVRRH